MVKTKDLPIFDTAEFLTTAEHIAGYLSEALATGDAADIAEPSAPQRAPRV
jgi:DNA-binding phage protein